MIEDGVLRSPDVAAVFGIHLWPQIDFGRVGVRIGPLLSGADHFTLRLVGRGGHGASPHLAADPLPPANVIYQAFQTIRRNINALEPFVLSVCSFHGGTAYNIVPPEVEMRGTLRALDDGVRSAVAARMRGIVSGVAAAFEIEATLSLDISCPVLSPDADKMRLMTAAADKLGLPVQEVQPSMGSEDFAFYAREVPSAFVFLGTREEGRSAPLHSPQFDFNEAVLPLGAALLAQTALDALSAETAQS
jgi:amidohydrolase